MKKPSGLVNYLSEQFTRFYKVARFYKAPAFINIGITTGADYMAIQQSCTGRVGGAADKSFSVSLNTPRSIASSM